MTLTSWSFAIFLGVTLVIYRLVPARLRPGVLLVASYAFYASAFPAHALVLAALTFGTWWVGGRLDGSDRRRLLLGSAVTALLLVLGLFKYAGMFEQTLGALLGRFGIPSPDLPQFVAPLGLSYITFGLIHYLAEVYRGHAAPTRRLSDFALYAAFFPTITSGPIKRYREFTDDLANVASPVGGEDFAWGLYRIAIGLFKKVVIADMLQPWAAPLTDKPATQAPLALLVAVYAYTFVIYFDFSGYSDMAIGTARLFGFRILENFDRPYLRADLSQFWRGWHISLTRFITENVFIPLGGSRAGAWRTALNTMIAMLASGLWHGAAWHYVVWGGVHGAGLVFVRLWHTMTAWLRERVPVLAKAAAHPAGAFAARMAGIFVTFQFVAFAWVLFVAPVGDALTVYRSIAGAAVRAIRHLAGV